VHGGDREGKRQNQKGEPSSKRQSANDKSVSVVESPFSSGLPRGVVRESFFSLLLLAFRFAFRCFEFAL
jgi:hypothetical protein